MGGWLPHHSRMHRSPAISSSDTQQSALTRHLSDTSGRARCVHTHSQPGHSHGFLGGASPAAEAAVPAGGEQHPRRRGRAARRRGAAQGGGAGAGGGPGPCPRAPSGAHVPGRVPPGRGGGGVPDAPPARGVPGGLRVLPHQPQLPRPVRDVPGALPRVAGLRRAQRAVHDAAAGAVGARRGDVPAVRAALHPAVAGPGVLPRRGGAGHLLRHRRPARQDQGVPAGHRHPGGELQPVRADAVLRRHDHAPVQAPRGRAERAPRRDGVQRGAHLRGGRAEPAAGGAARGARAGGVHGDHHAQLLHGARARDAAAQLPVPHGRRGGAAVHGRRGRAVPAGARGAHAPGSQRRRVPLRVPGGGRPGQRGDQPVQGPDEHRRRRAQGQHHGHGPACAAGVGAAAVRALLHRAQGAQQPDQAIHPRLPHGVRALLHPRGRARRHRRAAAQPDAVGRAGGGVADDAAPVRQHVQQLAVVRAGVHRGQGPHAEGRPRLDDRVRLRVQVQQHGVGVHPPRAQRRRALGQLHPPLPRPHPRRAQALAIPASSDQIKPLQQRLD